MSVADTPARAPTAARAHLIACGVLRADVAEILDRERMPLSVEFLPGGLHDRPQELRARLQERIDAADATPGLDRVILGYGLCGRGTVGLTARSVPLVIPRVQDCIALFLGSDAAYRRQFKQYPGTYYVSAGWYEEKVRPASDGKRRVRRGLRGSDEERELAKKYGEEEARAILDFLTSWQRNYQRAVFIDTGAPKKRVYAEHAREMAEEFGWRYEELPGSLALLTACLTTESGTPEIALVAAGHTTIYDAAEGGLRGVPRDSTAAVVSAAPSAVSRPPTPSVTGPESLGATPHTRVRTPPRRRVAAGAPPAHLGLGIDAGGTYTDVVLFDRDNEVVLAKSKAPTTKWDFTLGIDNALDGLDQAMLSRCELVSVSTTLATNAIVEGQGQRVGLILMPPYGLYTPGDVPHEPTVTVRGRMDITGVELEPVYPEDVLRAARELRDRDGAESFAVSGFGGSVNPAHELEVKEILRGAFTATVTCGHELSSLLDFRTRAVTAVLNARIIPRLARFLRDAGRSLDTRGIRCALMVVKGDGTLMSQETALERPVETILSGPSASVAGARYLTGLEDAIVVDVGGTTTDTAVLRGGEVALDERGTRVGGHDTHVKALRMRTVGLGGDSLVALHERSLELGPRRVAPVAWLATRDPRARVALDYLDTNLDDFAVSTHGMELFVRTGDAGEVELSATDRAVLAALDERPYGATELARKLGMTEWMFLDTRHLEEHHLVERCGCTPTDMLHTTGGFTRWDAAAAARICDLYARLAGLTVAELVERVMGLAVERLAREILLKQMEEETAGSFATEGGALSDYLMRKILTGSDELFGLRVTMRHPVVGIGAPVGFLLPQAARILGAEAVIPEDADVANAVGAVTSSVVIHRVARIRADDEGRYVVEGVAVRASYPTLDEAHAHARRVLEEAAREAARKGGAGSPVLTTSHQDKTALTADGTELFLERLVTVKLSGRPEVTLARPA